MSLSLIIDTPADFENTVIVKVIQMTDDWVASPTIYSDKLSILFSNYTTLIKNETEIRLSPTNKVTSYTFDSKTKLDKFVKSLIDGLQTTGKSSVQDSVYDFADNTYDFSIGENKLKFKLVYNYSQKMIHFQILEQSGAWNSIKQTFDGISVLTSTFPEIKSSDIYLRGTSQSKYLTESKYKCDNPEFVTKLYNTLAKAREHINKKSFSQKGNLYTFN